MPADTPPSVPPIDLDCLLGDARSLADPGEDFGDGLGERELEWLIAHEWARSADDVLWRRSQCGLHMTPEQRQRAACRLGGQGARPPPSSPPRRTGLRDGTKGRGWRCLDRAFRAKWIHRKLRSTMTESISCNAAAACALWHIAWQDLPFLRRQRLRPAADSEQIGRSQWHSTRVWRSAFGTCCGRAAT